MFCTSRLFILIDIAFKDTVFLSLLGKLQCVKMNSALDVPGANAFGHADDVTEAGRSLDLCPRAHCHGNQLLSQSVTYLNETHVIG